METEMQRAIQMRLKAWLKLLPREMWTASQGALPTPLEVCQCMCKEKGPQAADGKVSAISKASSTAINEAASATSEAVSIAIAKVGCEEKHAHLSILNWKSCNRSQAGNASHCQFNRKRRKKERRGKERKREERKDSVCHRLSRASPMQGKN
eukprot:1156599-Pelagomonas_calceolata.AAC.5